MGTFFELANIVGATMFYAITLMAWMRISPPRGEL